MFPKTFYFFVVAMDPPHPHALWILNCSYTFRFHNQDSTEYLSKQKMANAQT